ncbi:unnamed protein product [[Candida] boidinii]|nr:unnamed protein product [[Candida] boidinii]
MGNTFGTKERFKVVGTKFTTIVCANRNNTKTKAAEVSFGHNNEVLDKVSSVGLLKHWSGISPTGKIIMVASYLLIIQFFTLVLNILMLDTIFSENILLLVLLIWSILVPIRWQLICLPNHLVKSSFFNYVNFLV